MHRKAVTYVHLHSAPPRRRANSGTFEKSDYIMTKHSQILWWTFSSCVTLLKKSRGLLPPTFSPPPEFIIYSPYAGVSGSDRLSAIVNQWIDLEGHQSVLGSAKDPFSFHKQPPTPASPPASINIISQLMLTPSDSNTDTHLPARMLSVSRSPASVWIPIGEFIHG